MCILCHVSDFFRYIGYPMVMGFVHVFVSGVKFITAEELSPFVDSSEHENQTNTNGLTKRKFFLLDARRTDEFVVSHIRNATNIHSTFTRGKDSVDELKQKLEAICDKDTLIVTYCAVGLRSSWLAKYLTGMGYTNCKVLYHGFYEWTNSGRAIHGGLEAVEDGKKLTPGARSPCALEGLGAPTKPQRKWSLFGIGRSPSPPPAAANPEHNATEHQAGMTTVAQPNNVVSAAEAEAARHIPINDTVVEGKNHTSQTVHMCSHACRQTNKVLPQHFIASLALEQKRSTKDKFPLWLGPHRKISA
eukprot:TRINITY_DN453_c0_g2_i1.p1 TRINITY_DN453_c0_g2~~TRINITY_DN453_c0_g2_i1.p1  ORF type:complete len:303 (+),score=42.38 TRINITY_DN453_c0_g2_i1:139-1047(+)